MTPPTPETHSDRAPRSTVQRARREAPWLLGVVASTVLMGLRVGAFQPHASPSGADWWEYRLCAHVLQHPEYAHYYPPWRPTVYPYLLGLLGEPLGYPWAAELLASGSAVLMLLGAALAARALAGPWAGAVAALGVALLPTLSPGSHWTNPYPLMGALVALGIAAALAAQRWPRWPWVATAGLITGLGWAADNRGIMLAPLTLALVALGPVGSLRSTWKTRAALLLLALATMAPGKALERAVAVKQAAGMFDNAAAAVDPGKVVPPMNLGEPPKGATPKPPPPPTPGSDQPAWRRVLDQGSAALAGRRIQGHMIEQRSLPPLTLCWLPLLALLPGRRGWRGSLAALVVLGFTLVQVLVPAWLTDFGARYAYFFLAPVVVLVTAAPFRLVDSVAGRLPRWLQRAGAGLAALALVLVLWGRRPPQDFLFFPEDRAIQQLDVFFADQLAPGDRWMECGVLGAETHWYPRLMHDGDLNPYGADWELCRAYVAEPPAPGERRWLVSVANLTQATPEAPGLPFSSSIPDPAGLSWQERHRFRLGPETPEVIVWSQEHSDRP